MRRQRSIPVLAAVALALIAGGCATKKYVGTEVAASEARGSELVDTLATRVEASEERLDEHDVRMDDISATARDALDRAVAAGQLAEGKFLYEVVLSEDKVRFDFDRADLGEEARSALAEFGEDLRADNRNVFIEIQGHTCSTGSEEYNLELGERRAEAVRRYLSREVGVPLHRMSVVSYGESAPVADNGDRESRARNRRVTLVVLE